jgi:hypothetical protein
MYLEHVKGGTNLDLSGRSWRDKFLFGRAGLTFCMLFLTFKILMTRQMYEKYSISGDVASLQHMDCDMQL